MATRVAENLRSPFHGVLAIGAALLTKALDISFILTLTLVTLLTDC